MGFLNNTTNNNSSNSGGIGGAASKASSPKTTSTQGGTAISGASKVKKATIGAESTKGTLAGALSGVKKAISSLGNKSKTSEEVSSKENNEDIQEKPSTQNQGNMFEAILAALGPITSGVTGIFTSRNQLKTKQAEADNLAKQIDLEEAKGRNEVLVQALEVKKEEISRLESQDKAAANIRAVLYVGAFAVISFIAYLIFWPKKTKEIVPKT